MSSRKVILMIVGLILLLVWRFTYFYQHQPHYRDGQEIKLQVVLYETPIASNQGQRFAVKTEDNKRISIRSNLKELYHYGDKLAITGKLQVRNNSKGTEFYSLNFPKIRVVNESGNPIFEASRWIRLKSTVLFEGSLPPISANLLLGIVFGAKGDFPPVFWSDLRNAGVLHIIAASGMNVSFFTGAVMFSLNMFLKRRLSLILAVFAAIFYSFLVGFEASILRATIMAIIAFTASFFGRQNFAVLALIATGFVMLLWSPAFLFDVGFQLSFLATLGILLLKPLFGAIYKFPFVGEDLVTTVSAQLATTPILLGTFGSIGLWSLLVNILVLWTVPILMLLGSMAVILGLVFAPLGKLLLFLCLPFLLLFEKVVTFFGGFSWSLAVDVFPWQFSIGYYLILVAAVILKRQKQVQDSKL